MGHTQENSEIRLAKERTAEACDGGERSQDHGNIIEGEESRLMDLASSFQICVSLCNCYPLFTEIAI